MKVNTSRMWRSGIAMLLALCLVVGFFPVAAFATDSNTESDPLVYVSIGDSMTNGYGLPGYEGQSGMVNYGTNVYANQFAAWLAGYEGEIKNDQVIFIGSKGIVDHRQLAMSGFRAEDLNFFLGTKPEETVTFINDDGEEVTVNRLQLAYFQRYHSGAGEEYDTRPEMRQLIQDEDFNHYWWRYGETDGVKNYWFDVWDMCAGDAYMTQEYFGEDGYRMGDGAAKILATYNAASGSGYESSFKSSYATDANVQAAVAGLADSDTYPNGCGDLTNMLGGDKADRWKYLQIVAEYYQESVEDADVITLSLGNTNFGTFMFDHMKSIIREPDEYDPAKYERENSFEPLWNDIIDWNPAIKAKVQELMGDNGQMSELIDSLVGDIGGLTEDQQTAMKHVIKWCTLSYLINYTVSVERILKLNPDVTLIQVALLNAYKSDDESAETAGLNFSDVIDLPF